MNPGIPFGEDATNVGSTPRGPSSGGTDFTKQMNSSTGAGSAPNVRYVGPTQKPGSPFDNASDPSKVPGSPMPEVLTPPPGVVSAPSMGTQKPFKITGG